MPASTTQGSEITIAHRYCGPPESANGGYACGRLAAHLPSAGGPAWPEVTLRAPPPLGKSMVVLPQDDRIEMKDGDTLVGEARWVPHEPMHLPKCPSPETARDAAKGFVGFTFHPLPTCFVCGTKCPPGECMELFTGPVPGVKNVLVASPWVPKKDLAEADGLVGREFIWAALDCPGSFAVMEAVHPKSLMLLGRLSAWVARRPTPGESLIVTGWHIGSDGRKHRAGTAVFTRDGQPIACARAVWIELK